MTYQPVEYPSYGSFRSFLKIPTIMKVRTHGLMNLMQRPQYRANTGSHQSLTKGSTLPTWEHEYAIFLTPHMQISSYHCLMLRPETFHEPIITKMKVRMKARKPHFYESSTVVIMTIIKRGIQYPKLKTLRLLACSSDFSIVCFRSKNHPHPKAWRIPIKSKR